MVSESLCLFVLFLGLKLQGKDLQPQYFFQVPLKGSVLCTFYDFHVILHFILSFAIFCHLFCHSSLTDFYASEQNVFVAP